MKIILLTQDYGERVCVRVQYNHQLYFNGRQPAVNRLILLDLPGLHEYSANAVLQWLKQNGGESFIANALSPRREISEFAENLWREAVLDDYIEAFNYSETVYYLYQHFPAESFAAFGDKWLNATQHKLETALQKETGIPRIRAFNEVKDFLERIYRVMDKTPQRLTTEIEEMRETIDRARFSEVRTQSANLEDWIAAANNFETEAVRQEAVNLIAVEIVRRRVDSKEIYRLLQKFGVNLQNSTRYYGNSFWTRIAPFLKLEQNTVGQTIDLTEAVEEKVPYGWELLNAKRVGSIAHNRNALVIKNRYGAPQVYVSGERKLKFQIQRNGGSLQKFGCTLTVGAKDQASIHPALLEVEKIDALANLDVEQALEKVAHLNLPPDHLIFYAAQKAKTDAKQSRVLADLLIELLVGVDADIARHLARAQSRGNRR